MIIQLLVIHAVSTPWSCHFWQPGVRLIYLNPNQDSKSWFWFTVLFEQIGNRISNRVDHTQFIILSESIIQDGRDGVLHRFIRANQKHDSESRKSYFVQVSKQIKYIPWIIELKHSVCKVPGSCLWFWNHDLESCFWFGYIKHTPDHVSFCSDLCPCLNSADHFAALHWGVHVHISHMLLNFSGICNLFYLCPFIDFKFFFKSNLILTYSSGKDGVYPWVQQDKGLNKVDLIFKVVL